MFGETWTSNDFIQILSANTPEQSHIESHIERCSFHRSQCAYPCSSVCPLIKCLIIKLQWIALVPKNIRNLLGRRQRNKRSENGWSKCAIGFIRCEDERYNSTVEHWCHTEVDLASQTFNVSSNPAFGSKARRFWLIQNIQTISSMILWHSWGHYQIDYLESF